MGKPRLQYKLKKHKSSEKALCLCCDRYFYRRNAGDLSERLCDVCREKRREHEKNVGTFEEAFIYA